MGMSPGGLGNQAFHGTCFDHALYKSLGDFILNVLIDNINTVLLTIGLWNESHSITIEDGGFAT